MKTYTFNDNTTEDLPVFCPENDLMREELFNQFDPVIQTFESNENWTMFSCYSGMIAEIKPGLFLYSFGDIDEVGEANFYVKSEIKELLDLLLTEWGPAAPPWREFLKSVGNSGYPENYEPGSMVDHKIFFPKLEEDGLLVGLIYNLEMTRLHQAMRELK